MKINRVSEQQINTLENAENRPTYNKIQAKRRIAESNTLRLTTWPTFQGPSGFPRWP